MQRFLENRPSPAMAVAFLALLAALSGTAVALPGRGTVDSGDIKNSTVRGKDVRGNTLTGKDISERKLGKVPEATAANTATSADTADFADRSSTAATATNAAAISGQAMRRFDFAVNTNDPSQTFTFGGVEVSGSCASGNSLLQARNVSGQAAAFQSGFVNNVGATSAPDENFTSGDADALGQGGSGSGTASVSFADSTVTTIVSAYQDAGQTGGGCHYWGRVIAG